MQLWASRGGLLLVAGLVALGAAAASGPAAKGDPSGQARSARGHAARLAAEPGDLVLDTSNFDEALAKYADTGMLVEFFLPWCGHSRRLRPEFTKAAATMGGTVLFARVDCSAPNGAALCHKYEIAYHPTLVMFSRGHEYEYTKRGSASELTRYARLMVQDAVREVAGIVEASQILEVDPVVVLGFHEEDQDLDEFFYATAENLKDQLTFVSMSNPRLLEAFSVTHTPAYAVMRQGVDSVVYDRFADAKSDEDETMSFGLWVAESSVNVVERLTQENYSAKMGGGLPALVLFLDGTSASAEALRALYKSAWEFWGKVNFCQIDGRRYPSLTLRLGVKPGVLPSIVMVDVAAEAHYILPPPTPITPETIRHFVHDFREGKLQRALRSAEEPVEDSGPVYTLVADTFDRQVLDSSKDVMVNFRTRWCGFCNVFVPVYESVAKGAEKISSLVLYEFDLSDNDPLPSLNVTASPTLLLFPAKNKTAIPFLGERTVGAITEFLREHVSVKFEVVGDGELVSADEAENIAKAIESVRSAFA